MQTLFSERDSKCSNAVRTQLQGARRETLHMSYFSGTFDPWRIFKKRLIESETFTRLQLCPIVSLYLKGGNVGGLGDTQSRWKTTGTIGLEVGEARIWGLTGIWSKSSEGQWGGEGSGASDVRGEAEGPRLAWPGEEKVKSARCCFLLHSQHNGEARPPAPPSSAQKWKDKRPLSWAAARAIGFAYGTNSSSWEVSSAGAAPGEGGEVWRAQLGTNPSNLLLLQS